MSAEDNNVALDRLQRTSLLVGVIALLLGGAGAALDLPRFFQSYLVAYTFWWQITVGCLALAMLHYLMVGMWGLGTVRLFEAGARTVPLVALMFVPVALGAEHLYVWARPLTSIEDEVLRHALEHKEAYLNLSGPFGWLVRALLYFAIWAVLAFLVSRWSLRREQVADHLAVSRRLRRLSAAGIILFGLTTTFGAIDWLMSLEPTWFSTIFGGIHAIGAALAGLMLSIAVLSRVGRVPPLSTVTPPAIWNDIGNVALAGVMLYAYFQLSQFLIIWSGNLPDEAVWYLRRMENGWGAWPAFLAVLHFAVPFLLLLSRDVKRDPRAMGWLACGLLVVHYFDLIWEIVPAFGREPYRVGERFVIAPVHWMDVVLPIGLGGLWLFTFAWQLKGRPLTPANDPAWVHLHELLEHGHEESHVGEESDIVPSGGPAHG